MIKTLFKNLVLTSVIVLIVCSYFFSQKAFAQESEGINITVSPAVLDLTASPGKKIQEKVRLRNNLENPLDLQASIYKMQPRGEDGDIAPIEPEEGDDYISWITFDKPEFTAPSKEWIDVKFTIDIPETAGFGYYYALKFAKEKEDESTDDAAVLKGEVLVPLLLNVKKEGAKADASILSFKAKSYINEYLPVDFETRVANTGNIHIKPRGNIFIRGWGSKDIGVLDVNKANGNVLPESTRIFQSSWDNGFLVKEPVAENGQAKLDGKGNQVTKLKINWNKLLDFRFGKYTAYMIMVYDNGGKDVPIEATTTFWVIPYKALIVILIIIIALVILFRVLLKRYVKSQIQKYAAGNNR
jgi:hypothetical protein